MNATSPAPGTICKTAQYRFSFISSYLKHLQELHTFFSMLECCNSSNNLDKKSNSNYKMSRNYANYS